MNGYDNPLVSRRSRRRASGGFVFGLVIIAIGTVMLLDTMGIVRARDFWDYAPLVLAAVGVSKIIEGQGRLAPSLLGGILAMAGTFWFLDNIDVFRFNTHLIFPVIVIGLGITFLLRALESPRFGHRDFATVRSDAQVNLWAVFGGSKRVISSTDFQSADLIAVFGGIELDLRPARIVERAVIDANAMFGGIEIRVPQNWIVEVRGMGIFGGYEDKTIHPPLDSPVPPPVLVVTGFAVFGGVSVQHA